MIGKELNLEAETRCDFLVTQKRKKIWKVQIELAEEVKRICEKYKIKYFIIWGTLLGAVRHQGYIPWDDDFDIGFLREDYERFLTAAKREIREPYFLQTALTDTEFFMGYARLRDSRTTGLIIENRSLNYNNGIFVDLYPLDVIPENSILRKFKFWCRDRVLELCMAYSQGTKRNILEKRLCHIVSYKKMCEIFSHCCQMGNRLFRGKVGIVYHPVLAKTYYFEKKNVDKTVKLIFEHTSFEAPAGYIAILQEVYGNYQQLPPKRKRGQWHQDQIVFDPDMSYVDFIKAGRRVIDENI